MQLSFNRANPYWRDGEWFFRDERNSVHGPYPTERTALVALLCYAADHAGNPPKKPLLKRLKEWIYEA